MVPLYWHVCQGCREYLNRVFCKHVVHLELNTTDLAPDLIIVEYLLTVKGLVHAEILSERDIPKSPIEAHNQVVHHSGLICFFLKVYEHEFN